MEKEFNEQDSLRVISEMINTARGNLQKGAGKYFILWGYVIFVTTLLHLVFANSQADCNKEADKIWGVAYAIGFIMNFIFALKDRKNVLTLTYTDRIVNSIWIGFGFAASSLGFMFGAKLKFDVYPMILVLYTAALFVSARAYRFQWMYIPVAICIFCVLSYKFIPTSYFPLPMGIALLSGNIVPGHILNYKAKRNV